MVTVDVRKSENNNMFSNVNLTKLVKRYYPYLVDPSAIISMKNIR